MPTITQAPSPKEFANAWTRGFAAAVRSEAGRDGRLSLREAKRIAEQGGNLATYGDNAVNYLEKTGQKSVSVNKLIGKGHDYAVAVSASSAETQAAGDALVRENLIAQRASVSGVSTDEESINLITFQRQYQGAARLISVADEMLQTLLSVL